MTITVYSGSFDPFTLGHLWVVQQAATLFARVHVVVADNASKQTLFTTEERVAMIVHEVTQLPNVTVGATHGMVVDYARDAGATVLVRGFRGAEDAEAEILLAQDNRELAPDIVTVALPSMAALREVSSSRLRARARRGDDLSADCSEHVAQRLRDKLAG
jgi:pantetheine-phosphate adenylyltransferase